MAQQTRMTGEWRRPTNTSADEKGGIHDDETASGLGFAGGTIAGSIHMEQFVPILVDHFGAEWWRRGGISLYFLSATLNAQPVRCLLEPTAPDKASIWMEDEDGQRIMQGSASLGDDPDSEIRQRLNSVREPQHIRMFADVRIGVKSEPVPSRLSIDEVEARLKVITEPMACFESSHEFGARVAPMAAAIHTFRAAEPIIAPIRGDFVGMFGAIEVQFVNGPILAEHDYLVVGEALALSESPKTEIIWHQHEMRDAQSGATVARMIKMDRLLKGASPLWKGEEDEG